jgi:uncharacterized protein (DUF697 family)
MKAAEAKEPQEFPQIEPSDKLEEAQKIVKKNMYWAMGIGIIPAPLVDVIGISAFQAKSIKELSDLYEITFYQHKLKNTIAILLSGLGAYPLATAFFGTTVKLIPGLGSLLGIASMPLVGGAITYAMGQVFIQHFESGGTFLDFDPKSVKEYFNEKIKEGMELAKETEPVAEKTAK